tara:strand:- start:706 stop:1416 length:711 start_codon:yes stop_codon:yes gene_type:complete
MKKYFALFCILVFCGCSLQKKYQKHNQRFEKDVQKLEHKIDAIGQVDYLLFIGSSSIRLWDSISQDMRPYNCVKRGYGGAHYYDLIHFVDRLIKGHQNTAGVVIFVANDITGTQTKMHNDLSPVEVKRLFVKICKKIKTQLGAETPIFVIETTPTPKRWEAWPKIAEANDRILAFTKKKNNLYYISTRDFFLNGMGVPDKKFFVDDQLHLNRKGYRLWGDILKNKINQTLSGISDM